MSAKIWMCSVEDLARETGGQVLSQAQATFSRVGTDTRQDLTGKLFIPLKGENFDGHDFVAAAVDKGPRAVLVHQWKPEWEPLKTKAAFIKVGDTLQALQAFARYWRRHMGFFVLAITGSNGKTSTKEFTLALLKDQVSTHASKGSYNNHWGVPLSILEAGPEHSHLILEMGMNKSGEIWRLCQIAEPNVVAVTMVGRAHIGELGSQNAVAQAKEEIYLAAPKAIHVFNMDNEWTIHMQTRSHAKQILFSSFKPDVDVHLRAQRMNWDGLDLTGTIGKEKGQCWVHVLGRHNVVNLMAASALALAAGLTPEQVWDGLGQISDVAWGRNQVVALSGGGRVLFDGYNSNPDSMQALLKNLFEMDTAGRKFLIVGDMKELGEFSEQAHEETGEKAGAIGFEAVWYVGQNWAAFKRGLEKQAPARQFMHSPQVDHELSRKFLSLVKEGDLVAIKGSRGMALEHVMDSWPLQTPLGKKP